MTGGTGGDWAQFISYDSAEERQRALARKRRRYRTDDAYRKAKQAASRARYKPKGRKKRSGRGRNKPRPYPYQGRVILLVGLGQFSDETGVSKATLRRYEDKGIIPINRIIDERGRRWYPKEFVNWLAPLLIGQSQKREPHWSLKARVEREWGKALAEGMPVLKEEQDGRDDD